jgi:hypothetical protein
MRRPNTRHHLADLFVHDFECKKAYELLAAQLAGRFQPQDAFESQFVLQILTACWQRARFQLFDLLQWDAAARHARQDGAANLIASGSLETITVQRSRHFGMAQDRHAQAFHRCVRTWTQCVTKLRTQKAEETNEPNQ